MPCSVAVSLAARARITASEGQCMEGGGAGVNWTAHCRWASWQWGVASAGLACWHRVR